MSTVVIVFPGAPQVDPAAAAREEAMKRSVARHVEGERAIKCQIFAKSAIFQLCSSTFQ